LKTINHPKNKEYYLYYVENKKRVRITSFKSVGKKQVYSNVKAGDKIFIPPGTIIKTPKANLAVMIR
jgi:oxalate decarboxylase/phosphoglucose isomerase-like protein (cupin superfamily)